MKMTASVRQQIHDWLQNHREEMMADIAALVAIDSARGEEKEGMPYGEGPYRALCEGEKILKKSGLIQVAMHGARVITGDLNENETELGILAHLDIVPVGNGWTVPALEMTRKDGKIFGRGVIDDKGPAVMALYAMRALKECGVPLAKNCRLILGSDEECGSSDIAWYFDRNPIPPQTLSPDASYPCICIEKGSLRVDVQGHWEKQPAEPRLLRFDCGVKVNVVPGEAECVVRGLTAEQVLRQADKETGGIAFTAEETVEGTRIWAKGSTAHASLPETGNNALTGLLTLLSHLPLAAGRSQEVIHELCRLFPHGDTCGKAAGVYQSDEESGELTLAFSILHMDEKGLSLNLDIRAPMCANEENVRDVLLERFADAGLTMKKEAMNPPHYVSKDSPQVQRLVRIFESYTGQSLPALAIGGGTYLHHIEGGVSFGCEFPGYDYNMHGADEYAIEEQLLLSSEMYAAAIVDICG